MKPIKYKFFEDDWKIYFLHEESYIKTTGEDNAAEMGWVDRTITFNLSRFDKSVVTHEITHVYIGYTFINEIDPKFEQAEEIFCELLSHQGKKILTHADKIYKLGRHYL